MYNSASEYFKSKFAGQPTREELREIIRQDITKRAEELLNDPKTIDYLKGLWGQVKQYYPSKAWAGGETDGFELHLDKDLKFSIVLMYNDSELDNLFKLGRIVTTQFDTHPCVEDETISFVEYTINKDEYLLTLDEITVKDTDGEVLFKTTLSIDSFHTPEHLEGRSSIKLVEEPSA